MQRFKDLARLDEQIKRAGLNAAGPNAAGPNAAGTSEETRAKRAGIAQLLARRGNLKAKLGLAQSAVLDLLRAQAQLANLDQDESATSLGSLQERFKETIASRSPMPFTLNAQLGEAFRIEARDVFLSSAEGGRDFHTGTMRSVDCFTRALNDLEAQESSRDATVPDLSFGKASEYRAWILAHRGAALTTKIWILLVGGKSDPALYKSAEQDLHRALDMHPTYAWCRRVLAVLLTLRDQGSDHDDASKLLLGSGAVDPSQQSALQRSLSLLSYISANGKGNPRSLDQREAAARRAVDDATLALKNDPDDFMSKYVSAASLDWLQENATPSADAEHWIPGEDHVSAAIDGAVTHCQNALSQASACLIGALRLRQKNLRKLGQVTEAEAEETRLDALHAMLQHFRIDLETAAIILRDPNLRELLGEVSAPPNRPQLPNLLLPFAPFAKDAWLSLTIE